MNDQDLWRLDVVDLAEAYRSGRVDPVDVIETCFERIRAIDPRLNAIVTLDADGARAAAAESAARWKAGQPASDVDGIPITVKDSLLVRGLRSTWGSRAYGDYVPDHDELPVARLRAAGMVIVGKTNVPELTLEGYTSNQLFGTTYNPWNPALTPGGSSGGAAASVAAGLVPAAIGTDGGGSIRRPASHTGLIGFKPSTGHVARGDGFSETLHDFEVVGTLTRSVADAQAIDAVLAGFDARDRRSGLRAARRLELDRLRILYVPRFDEAPLDPEVLAATDDAAARLGAQGHQVEQGPVFFDRSVTDEIWRVVGRGGVARVFRAEPRLDAEGGPTIQATASEGRQLSAADYGEALAQSVAFRRRVDELFTRYDLIFLPSAAALPWPAADPFPKQIDGKSVGPRGHAIYTGWVNVAGLPALALPLGFSAGHLPIGGQFVAPFGADRDLLAFGRRFEAAQGGQRMWPPLAFMSS